LASCGETSTPKSIAEAAGPGSEIKSGSDYLIVTATLPKQLDDAEYVGQLAALAKKAAQAIQSDAPDVPNSAKTLSILALRPDLDRLGNPGAHSFIAADFEVDDLRKAQIGRLGAYGILDLATGVQVVLPWQGAVASWCALHDRAPEFCARAKNSVAPGFWPTT
jgi:hypothetical protein